MASQLSDLKMTDPVSSKTDFPTSSQADPVNSKPVFPTPSKTVPVRSKPVLPTSSQTVPVFPNPIFPTFPQLIPCPIACCLQPRMYPLPYHTIIWGGLFPSKSIKVSGTVSPCAQRFHINLKTGLDIAFHLNPRFDQNTIVRNSKLSLCWGPEELHLPCGMPLMRGQPFTICIQCEAHCFKVIVNKRHQFDYNHRICNLFFINVLEVDGDITLTNIQA